MSPTTAKWNAHRVRPRLAALASLAAAAVATLSASSAQASGFLSARYGADLGNPIGDNAYSIYFNPAALTGAKGNQLSLDAILVYRSASYDRTETSPSAGYSSGVTPGSQVDADYKRSNTGKAKLGNFLASPFVGFVTDLGGSPVRLGLAAYIPFGGQASWGRNTDFTSSTAPGGNDGPQRWSTISGRVTSIYITPAAAFAIGKTGLSVGVNGSVVRSTVETVRARNADGSDDTANVVGRLVEGRSLVNVTNTTFAGAVGLYYEAIPQKLMFGASFTARPGFGQMRLKGTLKTQFGQTAQDATNDVELLQTLPDVWRLGLGYRINDKVMLRVDGNYVNWSVFRRQCLVTGGQDAKCKLYENGSEVADNNNLVIQSIERKWHDAFGVRVSGSYYLSDPTELFGSLGYDSSSVPDSTLDASFIDAPKVLASVGFKHRFGKSFALSSSYNHAYFFEVDTTGKSELNRLEGDSKQPSSAGKYNQQFFILDINGTIYF